MSYHPKHDIIQYDPFSHFKGTVHLFTCSWIYSSRLFCWELQSFGVNGCRGSILSAEVNMHPLWNSHRNNRDGWVTRQVRGSVCCWFWGEVSVLPLPHMLMGLDRRCLGSHRSFISFVWLSPYIPNLCWVCSRTCFVRRGAGLLGALPLAGTLSWSWGRSKSSGLSVGKIS